jgi:tetratricopeptide (TPR) repeat protein
MSDSDRELAPLREARAAVERLDTYATPQELAVALEAIGQAVERSLRQLLRRDASQPDDVRLHAFEPDVIPLDRVIVALRQQERISLHAAHAVHDLELARQRAAGGAARAADADQAAQAVRLLEAELAGRGLSAEDASLRASAHAAVSRGDVEAPAHEVRASEARSWQKRGLVLALSLVTLGALSYFVLARLSGATPLEQGVAAFNEGRMGVAEQQLRRALEDEDDHANAALYLARVLRQQQRTSEAGAVLNEARRRHPDDAGILRELGHLLARDLGRPAAAAQLYQRAVELEPDSADNWRALIQALRAAGDPTAALWLARAPAEVQAELRRAPAPAPE